MTTETMKNNILIAEFMGMKKGDRWQHWNGHVDFVHDTELAFDSDWSWLMPVVEKIEQIEQGEEDGGYQVDVAALLCNIETMTGGLISQGFENTKIESVYSAVVQFIKWFNSKQQ